MSKPDLIVGLDIGTTKICAVVGELSPSGTVDVLGIGTSPSTGLRQGVVVNIDQTVQSIKKALEAAESMAGCRIHTVYVGIAGSHIKGFNSHGVIAVKGGEVVQRDVDRVLDAARAVAIPGDREVIHILPQEYIVNNQRGIVDPRGMSAVRLEVKVHIVTGAVSSAQNIVRSCRRSGLEVDGIALESLASSKAVLTGEEREIGAALVDLGGGTTDIAIFVNDFIKHTGVVGLGGQNLTHDIAFGLRTATGSAEKIKRRHGCALADMVRSDESLEVTSVGGREPRLLSRRVLAEICEARMEEILFLVDRELVQSNCKEKIGAGVVLTGGAALVEGCRELAEQIFNLPTRIGYPLDTGGLKDVVNSPKYATAVGLLRYGAEEQLMKGQGRSGGLPDEDSGMFYRILKIMKEWFSAVS
jgi:cell division protein FtsA